MTSVRVLVGVLAVLLLVGSAVGCGQAADKSKQEAKKKVEGKAQQVKQEAKKKGQAKEQQAKKQAKKKLEQKKQDVIKTVAIKETEFKLSPSTITLSKPGTYAFKAENKGSTQHSLEIDGEGVKSEGGESGEAKLEPYLDAGQSGVLTLTFQKPGSYEMYCPVIGHRLAGMKGSVVVK
jgi:uncharacterized cupredoxin-like copper-binding protein